MSTIKVNQIQPTTESGSLEILGFRFLEKLLGDIKYKSDWSVGATYLVKDVVIYNNLIYRCKTNHTSTSTFDLTKWDLIDVTVTVAGVTPGTYTKVVVNEQGKVTSGSNLTDSDLPNISASKITTGVLGAPRLGSGTPTNQTYLCGDGTWKKPTIGASRQTIVATEGQTVFNITLFQYVVGSGSLFVYINGILQEVGISYNETSSTSITFTEGLTAGQRVILVDSRWVA